MYYQNPSGLLDNYDNYTLCVSIWHNFLKLPVDDLSYDGALTRVYIREYFFNAKWFEKYDFIEFCAKLLPYNQFFINCINSVLKEEFAGFSLINGCITPITDIHEINEIEQASSIDEVITEHLKTAVIHLSNKTKPDYRNSIKESISAVEAICIKIINNPNASLGKALNVIERSGNIRFHGAEKEAFSNLYGWTSSSDGIRHALMEISDLDQEDARFMLISCSSFINYLKIKANKAGIEMK